LLLAAAVCSVPTGPRVDALRGTTPPVAAAVCPAANSRMNIVAHEDDDLLFINPHTYTDISAGRRLTVAFFTAGDDGRRTAYWHDREDGAMAAYAAMAGARNTWTASTTRVGGMKIHTVTLAGRNVQLLFMRLPAGSPHGYAIHQFECLSRPRSGAVKTVHAVNRSAAWTSAFLRTALLDLMTMFHPSVIRTLDYSAKYTDGSATGSGTTPSTVCGHRR
jgi:LmbE family N-acetylglucosaminyl deacetylase